MPPELQSNLQQDSVMNWHIKRAHLALGTSLCCHRLYWERGAPLCRWQESPARQGREVEQNQAAGFWHSARINQVPSWPCHGLHPSALYSLGNLFFLSHRDRNLSSRHGKCQGSCPSFSLNVCQTRDKQSIVTGGGAEGARKAAYNRMC